MAAHTTAWTNDANSLFRPVGLVLLRANWRLTCYCCKIVSGFVKNFGMGEVLFFLSATRMSANLLPLAFNGQLEKAGAYRNFGIVVPSAPPRCAKIFVVFVNYPGQSSLALS
jgi:hypothetical protein